MTTQPPSDLTQPDFSVDDALYVEVRSGIFSGKFPIRGMTVGEARRALGPLMNIDQRAKAMIDGHLVDESHPIDEQTTALLFIRASGEIG